MDSLHFRNAVNHPPGNRGGFTLIELVVVVLILGILAAVAAPRMFDTATDARESTARHSLAVLRDCIELYRAQNGVYPGTDEASFKAGIRPLLRGPFPSCPVGNQNDQVRVQTTGAALAVSGTQGWAYDNVSGELIINSSAGTPAYNTL